MTTRAVLLDAFGTLLAMEPPAPVLTGLLADAGYDFPEPTVADALAAEIRHYRVHMQRGADAEGLADLRAECAGVLVQSLGDGAPPVPLATELLVESLRFRLHDDAVPAMDALSDRGMVLGVVSNWDCALPTHLERLGVRDRFAVVAASAPVGARKPDPAIFRHALAALDVAAGEALHVGDQADEDVAGARAAGVAALLLDRSPGATPRDGVVTSLAQVPALVGA